MFLALLRINSSFLENILHVRYIVKILCIVWATSDLVSLFWERDNVSKLQRPQPLEIKKNILDNSETDNMI